MNIAICDDNMSFCEQVQNYLLEYFDRYKIDDYHIFIFNSGEQLLQDTHAFDFAFLDVEMSGLSGIHTGKELKKRNNRTIFFIITSYNDYLDEAFKFHAFRYLQKPLDKMRLFTNLKDALRVYYEYDKKVIVETKLQSYTINISDIIMIETINKKATIHTTTCEYETTKNLAYWMDVLQDYSFYQCHKSFIINLKHVDKFDSSMIYLNGSLQAYMAVRKHNEFKKIYMRFLDSIA